MPYISVLQKYTQFNGRADRWEFWGFTIVQFFLLAVTVVVDEIVVDQTLELAESEWRGGLVAGIFLVLTFMPWVCVWARRLQDRHDSGFLQFLFWVPFATYWILDHMVMGLFLLTMVFLVLSGIVLAILLFLCALPGDPQDNKYGPVASRGARAADSSTQIERVDG